MRTIPSELLNRVKKKWQVPAENSDPKMKVYLSRGLQNELFQVFTIQEGELLTDVDVTVSRPNAITLPATAYALAINNGLAQVKSKPLPYDDQFPWEDVFDVASGVTSVAIEFDGYWDRDYNTGRFNFVTEEHPWLFYVQAGNLYMQYWQDSEELLATNVTKCAAVRGWVPANGQTYNDQGLIVAYIKTDGKIYYRSLCVTPTGKAWESEREVTELGSGIDDLALFRTNDFRVGFLAEKSGVVYWAITERNWSGMSSPAEVVGLDNINLAFGAVNLFEIRSWAYRPEPETAGVALNTAAGTVNLYTSEPPTIQYIESASVVDLNTADIKYAYPVDAFLPLKHTLTLPGQTVVNAYIKSDGRTVRYELEPPFDPEALVGGTTASVISNNLIIVVNKNRREFITGSVVSLTGVAQPHRESVLFNIPGKGGNFTLHEIMTHKYTTNSDTVEFANIEVSSGSVVLTDTGYTPV